MPEIISISSGTFGKRTGSVEHSASADLQVVASNLRTFRVLRSLKVVSRFQKVKLIVLAVTKAFQVSAVFTNTLFLVKYALVRSCRPWSSSLCCCVSSRTSSQSSASSSSAPTTKQPQNAALSCATLRVSRASPTRCVLDVASFVNCSPRFIPFTKCSKKCLKS